MHNFPNKSFLSNFYLAGFFYEFIFAYAIYTLLFSLRGLDVFQISLLIGYWSLVSIVFEVPSGALADYWDRKKMLIIAPLIKALCFIVWYFAQGNFYLYAAGFTLWGLSESFMSGTSQALLYDTLVAAGKKDEFEKVLGRVKFFFYISLAISIISGGFIANYNLDLTLLVSIVPLLLSSVFASRLPTVPRVESTREVHYLTYIKEAVKEIRNNRVFLYLFIYFMAISIFGILEEFDQLYFQLIGLPVWAFGIVGFLWSGFNAVGAFFAYKIKDHTSVYYIFPFVSAVFLAFVSRFASLPMLALLLGLYFISSPIVLLIESKIQHSISGPSRATVTSFSNLIVDGSGALLTFLLGFISRIWNLQAIYLSAAVILLILSFWTISARRQIGNQIEDKPGD